jgi:hypothetical protein
MDVTFIQNTAATGMAKVISPRMCGNVTNSTLVTRPLKKCRITINPLDGFFVLRPKQV